MATRHILLVLMLMSCIIKSYGFARYDMSPKGDLFLFVGKTLRLNCTVTGTGQGGDVYDLIISKNSQLVPGEFLTYYPAQMTIGLVITNLTYEDSGIYYCGNKTEPNLLQNLSFVQVGEPPPAAEHLSCVSNNFLDLCCNFSVPRSQHQIPSNWTMLFQGNRASRLKRNCTHLSSCSPGAGEGPDTSYWCDCVPTAQFCQQDYSITVTGKNNSFEFQTHSNFTVSPDKNIVKPAPVKDLTCTGESASSAELSWGFPNGLARILDDMEYRIIVRSTQHPWFNKTFSHVEGVNMYDYIENMEKYETQLSNYTVSGLYANTRYEASVQIKPVHATGEIYWSEPQVVDFITHKSVPGQPPSWTVGSYVMLHRALESKLVVYWRNPHPRYWGADVTGFTIHTFPVTMATRRMFQSSMTSDPGGHFTQQGHVNVRRRRHIDRLARWFKVDGVRTFSPVLIDGYETMGATIEMMNTEGNSSQSPYLVLPAGESVGPSWVTVQLDKSRALVSWNMDNTSCSDVTSATYFWCSLNESTPSNLSFAACLNDFDWQTVQPIDACNKSARQLWLPTGGQNAHMRFAVAVATGEKSAGMLWEQHRYSKFDAVPLAPTFTVQPCREVGGCVDLTFMYVDYPVPVQGSQPDMLNVTLTPIQNGQEDRSGARTVSYSVNFTKPDVRVERLEHDSEYRVLVKAANSRGVSVSTKVKTFKTNADEVSREAQTIGMTVGSVVGVIAVTCIIVCGCFIRKRFQQYKLKQEQIIMPSTLPQPIDEKEKYFYEDQENQTDHDSGRGTDSGPPSLELTPKESSPQYSSSSTLSGYKRVSGGLSGNTIYGDSDVLVPSSDEEEDGGKQSENNAAFVQGDRQSGHSYMRVANDNTEAEKPSTRVLGSVTSESSQGQPQTKCRVSDGSHGVKSPGNAGVLKAIPASDGISVDNVLNGNLSGRGGNRKSTEYSTNSHGQANIPQTDKTKQDFNSQPKLLCLSSFKKYDELLRKKEFGQSSENVSINLLGTLTDEGSRNSDNWSGEGTSAANSGTSNKVSCHSRHSEPADSQTSSAPGPASDSSRSSNSSLPPYTTLSLATKDPLGGEDSEKPVLDLSNVGNGMSGADPASVELTPDIMDDMVEDESVNGFITGHYCDQDQEPDMSNYINPDQMSLSTVSSDFSDATSVHSVDSTGKHNPAVIEICKQINALSVAHEVEENVVKPEQEDRITGINTENKDMLSDSNPAQTDNLTTTDSSTSTSCHSLDYVSSAGSASQLQSGTSCKSSAGVGAYVQAGHQTTSRESIQGRQPTEELLQGRQPIVELVQGREKESAFEELKLGKPTYL